MLLQDAVSVPDQTRPPLAHTPGRRASPHDRQIETVPPAANAPFHALRPWPDCLPRELRRRTTRFAPTWEFPRTAALHLWTAKIVGEINQRRELHIPRKQASLRRLCFTDWVEEIATQLKRISGCSAELKRHRTSAYWPHCWLRSSPDLQQRPLPRRRCPTLQLPGCGKHNRKHQNEQQRSFAEPASQRHLAS